ncbi:NUDIX hydrolase [Psychrobacillus sp. BM2]|uniref:NUDIX hydrolase n=1 Tax=Psychrobacillus sp. BM2 TaxID=3400421 RepID=UPI003B01E420
MISQGFVLKDNMVLMVQQHVQRGEIVWNFPGGGIHKGESPEDACIREIKEETGYEVKIKELLNTESTKFTYLVEIVGGKMFVDKSIEDNEDIIDVSWVSIDDKTKWDNITLPIFNLYQKSIR